MEEDKEVKVTHLHFLWQQNGRLFSFDRGKEWLKCSLCFSPPLNPWKAKRAENSGFFSIPTTGLQNMTSQPKCGKKEIVIPV